MIINTQGIVLSTIRYSDSSVIAKIYTESSGLRSFMIRTGKGRNALLKMSILQPLSLIEISFDKDEKKGLRTPRAMERAKSTNSIPFDTVKTCIALFMAEVIGRSIGEEEANTKLFEFLHKGVIMLDEETQSVNNFHLKFMLEFSSFLGFYPHSRLAGQSHFDLVEGEFSSSDILHPYVINGAALSAFEDLLHVAFSEHFKPRLSNSVRRELLQHLVDYFKLHLEGMKEITSHKVLEEVLI